MDMASGLRTAGRKHRRFRFCVAAFHKGALRDFQKTGTGFACAKLSEVLPPVATAPVVRMTEEDADAALCLRPFHCARAARFNQDEN
jgi:hypothetical protein